jgi:hypothetical protein
MAYDISREAKMSFIRSSMMFAMLFAMFIYSLLSAAIIYVPGQYSTIQSGINASSDGDTVLVQPGVYYENINFNGHNIVLGSLYLTTGDYAHVFRTIIDGGLAGPVVAFTSGEDSTAYIYGFTIQNGRAAPAGGGVNCENSSPKIYYNYITNNETDFFDTTFSPMGGGIGCRYGDPMIKNNIITRNESLTNVFWDSAGRGGGIGCWHANAMISGNSIYRNAASVGGAIYARHSEPYIEGNNIYENTAYYGFGGGIFAYEADISIINNRIHDHSVIHYGAAAYCFSSNTNIIENKIYANSAGHNGGILCQGQNHTMERNYIYYNHAQGSGGGISCSASEHAVIDHNLLYSNSASNYGAGLYLIGTGSYEISNNTIAYNTARYASGVYLRAPEFTMYNCIIWSDIDARVIDIEGDSANITYCDIAHDLFPGEGNISAYPLFYDPDICIYDLQSGSPCIDAGDPDSPPDPDSTRADMGALYYHQYTSISGNDIILPKYYLYQNYPNPFNQSTIIEYDLPEASDVHISIYNILGRKIETLVDKYQPAGIYHVRWNAAGFSSGIYFYRISTGDYDASMKMLLLK